MTYPQSGLHLADRGRAANDPDMLPSPSISRSIQLLGILVAAGLLLGAPHAISWAEDADRRAPLPGRVLRTFEVGEFDWQPGHRGVDLAGTPGELVRAAAAGQIGWVGAIDGVPMLSIQHPDGVRTTYQPVTAIVPVGTQVQAGTPIGSLEAGHCGPETCLHWGVREGERYLDPMRWLSSGSDGEVRLLPRDATPRQLPPGSRADPTAELPIPGDLPVAGPITAGFGGRINPISGLTEFHDGVDIGAPCGTPVQVLWPGTVSFVGTAGGFGLRVEVVHAGGRGSSYSHLSAIDVSVGQQLTAGAAVGAVGTTGYSTGCHLHYSVTRDDRTVDPLGAR